MKKTKNRIRLGNDGYFVRNGRRFVPAGVNYWPASCGVEMWQCWPDREIRHDLDVTARLGLNTVRFFLRWPDFEPQPGRYDVKQFKRLVQFICWCRERGLLAQPSLLVGWMSGGTFYPEWKKARNLYTDPEMLKLVQAYYRHCAEVLSEHKDALLAVEFGNEMDVLADTGAVEPLRIVEWIRLMSRAIRSEYPDAIIVTGADNSQVVTDCGWRLGQQPGTDCYTMHGYPVPAWQSVGFDGLTDPLAQSLLPFFVKSARAFGPVFLQEFGTVLTFGKKQQDSYLRGILPACWSAGANGFLWWCLRDINAKVYPYSQSQFEGTLGLVDSRDRVKPGLEYYLEFVKTLAKRPAAGYSITSESVGLYWPAGYYSRGNKDAALNDSRKLSRDMILANYLLESCGFKVNIVRGDQPLKNVPKRILITGAGLSEKEIRALAAWVKNGGRLVWHGPDLSNCGHAMIDLLGARPVDFRVARRVSAECFGVSWTFPSFPNNTRVEVEPYPAEVVSADSDGVPVLMKNTLSNGSIVWSQPSIEEAVLEVSGVPAEREKWRAWYQGILSA